MAKVESLTPPREFVMDGAGPPPVVDAGQVVHGAFEDSSDGVDDYRYGEDARWDQDGPVAETGAAGGLVGQPAPNEAGQATRPKAAVTTSKKRD